MNFIGSIAAVGLWACLAVIAYVYVGYPLTLALRRVRPLQRNPQAPQGHPRVTVVVAAYNEAASIEATVRNKLAQKYPEDLLDVIVVSDGSSDGTDEIVASIRDPRVTLLRQEPRQGKTLALNRGVAQARGDLIVFSDANSHYEPHAISRLVRTFADPHVGYVTGKLIYGDPGETAVGGGSGIYITYENWLRQLETRTGSIVGVNGGIDAVRRSLYSPMRADHLPDFVLPLRVVKSGFRVVYCEEAVAFESALGRQQDEFRMRVRVSLRALHALADCSDLFHPRHGFFAFQLLAHKLLRYLLIVPLGMALLLSAVLAGQPLYGVLFAVQVLCYALAAIGWASDGRIRLRLVFVPFYFCLINVAAGVAGLRFLRGERQVLWTPRKGA